ncbi:MAG: hypothetical protein ABI456_24685 [Ktedonobacteraceae bacterium]
MPFETSSPESTLSADFELGQAVIDSQGKKLGRVRARFPRYILVERGGIFVKVYYVPHSAIRQDKDNVISLSLSERDLRHQQLNRVPDDLYNESPEAGPPDISGVAQFSRGPLSPAETGHYNYGRRSPGINTDASGSYHREEVLPRPQRYVGQRTKIFATDPIPPREISPDQ